MKKSQVSRLQREGCITMAENKNSNTKNSLVDIASDLIGGSGITLDTVVDLAASALSGDSGSSKKSGSSRKKESKADDLISKLLSEPQDYPQFSEKTYWAMREKFQKNIPEKVTASTLTKATGLQADTIKTSVLPALEFLGLTKDGKPTSKMKAWVNDDKYEATCASIITSAYPDSLTKLGFNTEKQQDAIVKWFMKNADVSETVAKKMMKVYLLFAAAKLKNTVDDKKAASVVKKSSATSDKKKTAPTVELDSVKVTKKSGKATITVKVIADEGITKKALTDMLTKAAADAYNQMK